MEALPDELVETVLARAADRRACRLVCRQWRDMIPAAAIEPDMDWYQMCRRAVMAPTARVAERQAAMDSTARKAEQMERLLWVLDTFGGDLTDRRWTHLRDLACKQGNLPMLEALHEEPLRPEVVSGRDALGTSLVVDLIGHPNHGEVLRFICAQPGYGGSIHPNTWIIACADPTVSTEILSEIAESWPPLRSELVLSGRVGPTSEFDLRSDGRRPLLAAATEFDLRSDGRRCFSATELETEVRNMRTCVWKQMLARLCEYGHTETVIRLMALRKPGHRKPSLALQTACRFGHLPLVRKLLEQPGQLPFGLRQKIILEGSYLPCNDMRELARFLIEVAGRSAHRSIRPWTYRLHPQACAGFVLLTPGDVEEAMRPGQKWKTLDEWGRLLRRMKPQLCSNNVCLDILSYHTCNLPVEDALKLTRHCLRYCNGSTWGAGFWQSEGNGEAEWDAFYRGLGEPSVSLTELKTADCWVGTDLVRWMIKTAGLECSPDLVEWTIWMNHEDYVGTYRLLCELGVSFPPGTFDHIKTKGAIRFAEMPYYLRRRLGLL